MDSSGLDIYCVAGTCEKYKIARVAARHATALTLKASTQVDTLCAQETGEMVSVWSQSTQAI